MQEGREVEHTMHSLAVQSLVYHGEAYRFGLHTAIDQQLHALSVFHHRIRRNKHCGHLKECFNAECSLISPQLTMLLAQAAKMKAQARPSVARQRQ